VYELLYGVTICDMGSPDWSDEEVDAYRDTYSGTPVSSLEPTDMRPAGRIPAALYEGDIPWSPNVVGTFDADDDVWPGCGPPPAGWRVVVADPPYIRRRRIRLVRDQPGEFAKYSAALLQRQRQVADSVPPRAGSPVDDDPPTNL
jgi:hypothetical protein